MIKIICLWSFRVNKSKICSEESYQRKLLCMHTVFGALWSYKLIEEDDDIGKTDSHDMAIFSPYIQIL